MSSVLQISAVQSALSDRARSSVGKERALAHGPFETANRAVEFQTRVLETYGLIDSHPTTHGLVADIVNPGDFFDRASRDGLLEPHEIFHSGLFIESLGLLSDALRAQDSYKTLKKDFANAPSAPPLATRIRNSVNSEGQILDTASPTLATLRQKILHKRAEMKNLVESKVKEWHSRGLLQDRFHDVREGRFVVPVKVEQQSKLEGILVGKSNTGQSVFVEPLELTAHNNALTEVVLAIRSEELRILEDLSRELGKLNDVYVPWIPAVVEFDLQCAAGQLARDWGLNPVKFSENKLGLKNLFHPLLKTRGINPVKNSLALEKSGTTGLLISGPNTGGKTVLLKAAGLAGWMAKAGLFVGADPEAEIPFFEDIVALIGDDQDLSKGLSSFSAQIRELQQVLKDSRKPLLIIVDEILSSTDPEEASALAQSMIEEFLNRGHYVLVTSHFSELSRRCVSHPKVATAAMEFREQKPTYRMHLGEMGASHALEVAEGLGIPQPVISRARELVSKEKLNYERQLKLMQEREMKMQADFEKQTAEATQSFEKTRSEMAAKLADFFKQAEGKITEAIRSITSKTSSATSAKTILHRTSGVIQTLDALKTKALVEVPEVASAETIAKPVEFTAGMQVRLKGMSQVIAKIIEIKSPGVALLQSGHFKVEKAFADLIPFEPQSQKREARTTFTAASDSPAPRKIDIRGKRLEEALQEAERTLNQAFSSGATSLTVVTGHGTGALKQGLKKLLNELTFVREFKPEREGDDGAVIVYFE